jgi:hypothetical protein
MKLIVEYLEHAIQFERMADEADSATLREQFMQQAAAYRKLAAKRAAEFGLQPDSPG